MDETPTQVTPELQELLTRASESKTISRPRRQPRGLAPEQALVTLDEIMLEVSENSIAAGSPNIAIEESLYEDRRNDRSLDIDFPQGSRVLKEEE